ncbi:MAG: sulfotransferase family protein [Gammaproteobacteria bacterium]
MTMHSNSDVRVVQMWAGPRNVSTAVMYSFAQRPDTEVADEPLYGHYLKNSGADHPGRAEILAAMDLDGERVMRELGQRGPAAEGRNVLFVKQMAHHLLGIDYRLLHHSLNFLLIRDPLEMLPSLARVLDKPELKDTGLDRQVDLLEHLEREGQTPFCVDARELLTDPEGVLIQACTRLGLPFSSSMLSWAPGPRAEDGIWAPHWYGNVHRSDGFHPWRAPNRPFPEELSGLLEQCQPYYQRLYAVALRAREKP